MTVHINDGYLHLTNGTDYLKVYAQSIVWSVIYNPTTMNLAGGVNIGFDLGTFYVKVFARGLWLNTNTKYENFQTYLKTWQQANTLKIEISRDGTNKIKLDGTNTTFPVLVVGEIKWNKMSGSQEIYKAESGSFIQTGIAS